MKKVIFGIIVFIAFIGLSFADENVEKNVNGTSTVFASTDTYPELTCDSSNLKYFNIRKDNNKYIAEVKEEAQAAGGIEELKCQYKENGSFKNIVFRLKYTVERLEADFSFYLNKYQGGGQSSYIDLGTNLNMQELVSGPTLTSGNDYVTIDCASAQSCFIKVRDDFYSSEAKSITGLVEFKDPNGMLNRVQLKGTITAESNLTLIVGNYGKCNIGSGWKSDSSGNYKYDYTGGGIVLPDCDTAGSADKAVKFIGWNYYQACRAEDMVSAGTNYFPENTGEYKLYSCYEMKQGIVIHTRGAVVKPESNWIELGNDSYFILSDDKVTLPNIVSTPTLLGEGAEFLGWQLNGTTTNYKAGEVVEANRRVYNAVFQTSYSLEKEYSYNKIYVNESTIYSKNGVVFDNCESANTAIVTARMVNGQCEITGIAPTTGDTTVEVYGYASGTKYTLKLRVLMNGVNSGKPFVVDFDVAGDEHEGSSETTETPEEGSEVGKKTTGSVTATTIDNYCNNYIVNRVGSFDDASGNVRYYAYMYGWGMGMSKFMAYSKCSDQKIYNAICLDPSGTTPKVTTSNSKNEMVTIGGTTYYGIPYVKTQFKTAEFEKAASLVTQELVKNKYKSNMDELFAANVALRIISYDLNDASALNVNESNHDDHWIYYHQYKNMATYVRSKISSKKTIDLDLNTVDTYKNAPVSFSKNASEEKLTSAIVKYLNSYYVAAKDSDVALTEQEYNIGLENVEFNYNYEEKTATVTGKLELPNGIKNMKFTAVRTKYVTDYKNYKFNDDGTFEFTVGFNDIEDLNHANAIKFKVEFNAGSGRLKFALLKPAKGYENKQYQRMIIFDNDDDLSTLYLTFKVKSDKSRECEIYTFSELESDKNKLEEFLSKDCCQFITNQNSEVYKKYCMQSCVKQTYDLACDPTNEKETDVYSVKEAMVNGVEQYKTCVVDLDKVTLYDEDETKVNKTALTNTDKIVDAVGNKISLDSFKDNTVCRVSCKEDWDFEFSAFRNFTGAEAVRAGSYFSIDKPVYLSGNRTCVTTYIDVDGYTKKVDKLSHDMVDANNKYNEYKAIKNVIEKSSYKQNVTYEVYDRVYEDEWGTYSIYYACPKKDGTTEPTIFVRNGIEYFFTDKKSTCSDSERIRILQIEKKKKTVAVDVVDTTKVGANDEARKYSKFDYNGNGGNSYTNFNHKTEIKTCEAYDCSLSEAAKNGECWVPEKEFDDLKKGCDIQGETPDNITDVDGNSITDVINSSADILNNGSRDLAKMASDMAACQNFYMTNNEKLENNTFNPGETELSKSTAYGSGYAYEIKDNSKKDKFNSVRADYTLIDTKFAPFARFQYEELEFMNIIGDNNYLVSHDAKNENEGLSKTDNNKCVDVFEGNDGEQVQLCKNKVDTYGYKSAAGTDVYVTDTVSSNKGDLGMDVSTRTFVICQFVDDSKSQSDCAAATLYYYDVNYIKQSFKNGSYYRNYGKWYVESGSDMKAYTPNKQSAIESVGGSYPADKNKWSLLGSNDVFPVQMSTRRNIYRYVYSFDNIGYFANESSRKNISAGNKDAIQNLGRIMGASNSVMLNHEHTCFYEVFEDYCKCCGHPIQTSVYESKGNYKVVTSEYLSDYCETHDCNSSDPSTNSNNPSQQVYPSTVSLYDLSSLFGSKNWSENSEFVVDGELYETSKGMGLLEEIQELGESIYDDVPEYSFYFTPEALTKIKENNKLYGYGVNVDGMIAYGEQRIVSDDANDFEVKDEDNDITITHYGSKFLESLEGYVPTEYSKKTFISRKVNNVCQVTNSSNAAKEAYSLVKASSCRWVDYVQYDENSGNYFRLSYK